MVVMGRAQSMASLTPRQQAARERRKALRASLFGLHPVDAEGRLRQPIVTCDAAVLVVQLPHRLHTPNDWQSLHWRDQRRYRAAWKARLEHAVRLALPSRLPRPLSAFPTLASQLEWLTPTNRPSVTVRREVPSRGNFITDRDNRFGACKPLVDAFVKGGFLPNDRETDIDLVPAQRVSADGLDWTVVTIDARAPEHRPLPEASV